MLKIPLRLGKRILEKAGAKRVSKDAQKEIIKIIENYGINVAKLAVKNAEYFGRKTVKKEDFKEIK